MSSTEKSTSSVRVRRRLGIGAAIALVAGVLAGGVVAGRMDWSDSGAELGTALLEEPAVEIAHISSADGHASRGVFAQVTSTGHFCVWEAASASSRTRGGGCNLADDPLGGRPLTVSLAYDGGPSVARVRDARLFGLAEKNVTDVEVILSDGTHRVVSLRPAELGAYVFQAFGYRMRRSDLRLGLEPVAVVALDSAGSEIARQTTGFAG